MGAAMWQNPTAKAWHLLACEGLWFSAESDSLSRTRCPSSDPNPQGQKWLVEIWTIVLAFGALCSVALPLCDSYTLGLCNSPVKWGDPLPHLPGGSRGVLRVRLL